MCVCVCVCVCVVQIRVCDHLDHIVFVLQISMLSLAYHLFCMHTHHGIYIRFMHIYVYACMCVYVCIYMGVLNSAGGCGK
jgi:hypothetical protein